METNWLGYKTLVPGWPLALFRMAFGYLYLDLALQKAPWNGFGWLRDWVEKQVETPAFGWYAAFLREVMLPNFTAFATMSFLVEMAFGIALLLGAFTRLVGLAGFFWQVNIAIGSFAVPGEWYWIWPLLTVPQFCFAFSDAGRVLGLDHWIEPALQRRASDGQAWAGLLRYAS